MEVTVGTAYNVEKNSEAVAVVILDDTDAPDKTVLPAASSAMYSGAAVAVEAGAGTSW